MRRFLPFLALGFSVAGCAPSLMQELSRYNGQPAEKLVSIIGVPDNERQVAGRRMYVWANGSVGKDWTGDEINIECRVRANVLPNDIIGYTDVRGNEGGCRAYKTLLRMQRQREEAAERQTAKAGQKASSVGF